MQSAQPTRSRAPQGLQAAPRCCLPPCQVRKLRLPPPPPERRARGHLPERAGHFACWRAGGWRRPPPLHLQLDEPHASPAHKCAHDVGRALACARMCAWREQAGLRVLATTAADGAAGSTAPSTAHGCDPKVQLRRAACKLMHMQWIQVDARAERGCTGRACKRMHTRRACKRIHTQRLQVDAQSVG